MDQEENYCSVLYFENEGEQKEYFYMITLYILYIVTYQNNNKQAELLGLIKESIFKSKLKNC